MLPPIQRRAKPLGLSISLLILAAGLNGCAEPQVKPSDQHLQAQTRPTGTPPPLATAPIVPPPKPIHKAETYSVVVNSVPVRDILFALARDAKQDIDIEGEIDGNITLNALDQTLPQLLDRIARQTDLRWEYKGKVLVISKDLPFLKNYKVDYVNFSRQANTNMNVVTQITGAPSGQSGGGATAGMTANTSQTSVTGKSTNDFWETLVANVRDLLRETDRILPEGSFEQVQETADTQQTTGTGSPPPSGGRKASAPSIVNSPNPMATQGNTVAMVRRSTFREAASVIANRETGVIAVRASGRQHAKVAEFLERVLTNAKRQVLIEATVVEVTLNDQSQTGVDWKSIALGSGFSFRQNLLGTVLDSALDGAKYSLVSAIMGDINLSTSQKSVLLEQVANGIGTTDASGNITATQGSRSMLADTRYSGGAFAATKTNAPFTLGFSNRSGSFAAAMSLLSQYGRTKVISSPKITALNNQPAVLRVVDNLVYFTISQQTTTNQTSTFITYTSTPNTVAVGFVMNVVPQIDDNNQVTLTIRPSISRLKGYAQDPNPALTSVANLVPIVQTREMESVMKIPSGNTIMMGGLMEDSETRSNDGLPGLGELPAVGRLFSSRNAQAGKTELVVFLRPMVVADPDLEGDYNFSKGMLPGKDFFNQPLERNRASASKASAEVRP